MFWNKIAFQKTRYWFLFAPNLSYQNQLFKPASLKDYVIVFPGHKMNLERFHYLQITFQLIRILPT